MTRLVNEADIVNKTRPLFTLSLEMTRLVNETRLLLVPGVNSDIYSIDLNLVGIGAPSLTVHTTAQLLSTAGATAMAATAMTVQ